MQAFLIWDSAMKIAVIGAGPAGIFGAISAATHNPSAEIAVLEATRQPLAKILISGGGRCNVTHHCFDPAELIKSYPRGSKELRGPFSHFQPRDNVSWFEKHGVRLKIEEDGRIFPASDKSATIANCLLDAAASLGISIRLGSGVKSIEYIIAGGKPPHFEVKIRPNIIELFDRVLLATGGAPQGHRLAETLGHTIIPCVPSLFTFNIADPRLEGLSGVSFKNVKLTLNCDRARKLEQTGDIIVTHWGISGPAVLKLSSWGARALHENKYQADLLINFLPSQTPNRLYQNILDFKKQNGKKRVFSGGPFPLPSRYWRRIVLISGVGKETTWTNLTRDAMKSLINELTNGLFHIDGKGIFKEEFVTCGGINLKEVDFRTMQSKICPGLFFAGEILDIDGLTGGFNFQNAWTTGWLAGANVCR
jgi:predicted Rossmann fold flavoprotein